MPFPFAFPPDSVVRSVPFLRRRRIRRAITTARASGCGVYENAWSFEANHAAPDAAIVAWCREVAGRARRPYGVGRFHLTVVASADGHSPSSLRLTGIDAGHLYSPAFEGQVAALLTAGAAFGAAATVYAIGDILDAALKAALP